MLRVIERAAIGQRRSLVPGEGGLEAGRGKHVLVDPATDLVVDEGATARGYRAVVRVVDVGREAREPVQVGDQGIRLGLVRQVAIDGSLCPHVPERVAVRLDRIVSPDTLADPIAPPRETAILADRPPLLDGHVLVDELDDLEANVLLGRALHAFPLCSRVHILVLLSIPAGAPCRREAAGRLPRRRRAGALGRS